MPRKALPPGEKKPNFNAKLSRDALDRLKVICFRRSVYRKRKFSESQFITNKILAEKLPRTPTPEQIQAYIDANPTQRDKIIELSQITLEPAKKTPKG